MKWQKGERAFSSLKIMVLICLFTIFLSCAHRSGVSDSPPSANWKEQMQNMGKALIEIYPFLMSAQEFNALENREKIQKNVESMAQTAHGVNLENANTKDGNKIDKDPYMSLIAYTLDREIHLAFEGLKAGKRDFSRSILRSATSMCIRCHSRGQWGPEFVDWQKEKSFQKLSPLEKGDLLAAVRHYDQALQQYEVILSDKTLAKEVSDIWTKAGNSALNVAVRSKQDPQVAIRVVNTILSNDQLPEYQRRNAQDWLKTITAWKISMEKKLSNNKNKKNGEFVPLLSQVQSILKEARKTEDYWADRGTLIHYLRASALLHDFLRTEASSKEQAEALYLLGQSYEVLSDMGDGSANEFYYKACIKRLPHSKLAVNCYKRLEQNMFLDFSGRGDVYLPPFAMEQLKTLRDLAKPVEYEPGSEGKGMFDRQ